MMQNKKAFDGIIWIGCSALLVFFLADYMLDTNLVIGSALTGFAIGIAVKNNYLHK